MIAVENTTAEVNAPVATNDTHNLTRDFFLAGQALFTVSPSAEFVAKHGRSHYTYLIDRVDHAAVDDYPARSSYYVRMLAGPDNTSDYLYLGMLLPSAGRIFTTRASRLPKDSLAFEIVQRVLMRVWAGQGEAIAASGWKVQHCGRCGRCGRTLTRPESIESGIGPECSRKLGV